MNASLHLYSYLHHNNFIWIFIENWREENYVIFFINEMNRRRYVIVKYRNVKFSDLCHWMELRDEWMNVSKFIQLCWSPNKFSSFHRIATSICRKWCQHSLQNAHSIRIQRSAIRIGNGVPSGRSNEKTVPGRASTKIFTRIARHERPSSHRQFYAITKVTDRVESIRWFRTGCVAKITVTTTNRCSGAVQFPGSIGKVGVCCFNRSEI